MKNQLGIFIFFPVKLKLFKETSFSKATMVMRFPAKKNAVAHKLESLPESVRTYADVTTKIFRIDRLLNLLSNGAPLQITAAYRASLIRKI